MAEPDDSLTPGTLLGRYEIKRQLGRGGMGAVYEAIHRDLKKRVAIKVLSSALAANEEANQRFLREGEAASRIQHPHVVDVTDVGVDGAITYLVMEFLEGEDLAHKLVREGALAVGDAVDVLLPICAGLAVAHEVGVIHRDLKPENIFLARRRQGGVEPKLLDFGVSKVTGGNVLALTGTTATFGTPYYMPPEQVRGARQVDQRSDVYALGVVLYECVCGRRPFESDSIYTILHAIGAGEYPAPRAVRPDLPAGIEAAIVRAMRLDPDGRFPSARHFAAALLPFASETARLVWADTFRIAGPAAPSAMPPPGAKPTPAGRQPTAVFSNTTLGDATGQRIDGEPPASRSRRPLLAGVGLAAAAAIAAAVGLTRARPPGPGSPPLAITAPAPPPRAAEPTTFRVDVEADPSGAVLELDGVTAGAGRLHRELARGGHVHRLTARFPGYESTAVEFVDRSPAPRLALVAAAPPAAPGAPAQAEKTTERQASPTRRSKSASRSSAAPPAPASPAPASPAPASPALPRAPAPPKSANNAPVLD
jgi:eukaryotic-like serine/threonine-protein kinase